MRNAVICPAVLGGAWLGETARYLRREYPDSATASTAVVAAAQTVVPSALIVAVRQIGYRNGPHFLRHRRPNDVSTFSYSEASTHWTRDGTGHAKLSKTRANGGSIWV